jgi:5'-deoxynucleotidase YfbR-like HD superfamily hydrolase
MASSKIQNKKSLLRLETVAPDVYQSLDDLKRTGWVNRGVENPESVKEHTEALLVLAEELSKFLTPEERETV